MEAKNLSPNIHDCASCSAEQAVRTEKKRVRSFILQQRRSWTPEQVQSGSLKAQILLKNLPEWRRAASVACYLSKTQEAQTNLLIDSVFQTRRRLCVPVFCQLRRSYFFSWISSASELAPGHSGILEPTAPEWVSADTRLDLVVVPGLAFDLQGRRVGYGKGYYDRLLVQPVAQAACKAGLVFQFQIMKQLPACDWDVPMDVVVTDAGIYRMNKMTNGGLV